MLRLLPALTGLLLVVSFPRAQQGYLAWVAFVPLIVYVGKSKTASRAFWGGFAAAVIEFFALLIWIPTVLRNYGGLSAALAWAAYGLMVLLLACYPAAACAATKRLMLTGGHAFLLLLPVLWVLMEYAQTLSPFGGFPWLQAAYSQADYVRIVQMADITGVYGISFLILAVNTALAYCGLHHGRPGARVPLLAVLVVLGACLVYGHVSLRRWGNLRPDFRAAMLQGNLSADDTDEVLGNKIRQGYQGLADRVTAEVDLLLLPESPTPVFFQNDEAYRQMLQRLAARYPLGLVFNNIRQAEAGGETQYFNSAFFMNPNGTLQGIYDKIHLVPFGEYLPLKGLLFFAKTISRDVGGFSAGRDYRIVAIGNRPSNAIICFEAVFPALARRFTAGGSQLIINLTNDAWYGRSAAPYQHLAIARFRAVENRRYLLRAANSGISALIGPDGRIQASTGLFQEAICEGPFMFLGGTTLYTRYGDIFVFLCAIISCGSMILAVMRHGAVLKRYTEEE
jgi:apolipoprotein N-acyltransferase